MSDGMSDEVTMLSARLEEMEMRMTYQEATLEALNEVVIKLQDRLDVAVGEIQRMKQQMATGAEFVRPMSEETPPPHY